MDNFRITMKLRETTILSATYQIAIQGAFSNLLQPGYRYRIYDKAVDTRILGNICTPEERAIAAKRLGMGSHTVRVEFYAPTETQAQQALHVAVEIALQHPVHPVLASAQVFPIHELGARAEPTGFYEGHRAAFEVVIAPCYFPKTTN